MADLISLFPTYSYDAGDSIFSLESAYEFSYNLKDKEYALIPEIENGTIILKDTENGFWNPEDYDLRIVREITVRNGDQLYGNGPKAVACKNAVLALALCWYSPTSNQRGVVKIGDIRNMDYEQSLKLDCKFNSSTLRGKIDLCLMLYLKVAGTPDSTEFMFANEVGTKLGEIDNTTAFLDGKGSVFPIYFAEMKDAPLWDVVCSFDDPAVDDFESTVAIHINKNNSDSKYLDRTDIKNFNPLLLREVVASAMSVIIETVRDEDKDFKCLEESQDESVARVLLYFRDKLGWKFDSPYSVSSSIRRYLEKNLKKI